MDAITVAASGVFSAWARLASWTHGGTDLEAPAEGPRPVAQASSAGDGFLTHGESSPGGGERDHRLTGKTEDCRVDLFA